MAFNSSQSRPIVEDMSTTDIAAGQAAYIDIPVRFDFDSLAPGVSAAVMALHKAAVADLKNAGVGQGLIELVRLRASQLNGCAYCVDMRINAGEARPAGALEPALRDAIVAGRVPAGHRLPPTRGLAADLGIARTTVSEAYAQLTAEGWLEARVGAGTWVAQTAEAAAAGAAPLPPPAGWPGAGDPASDPRLVNLYGGRPDPSLFPRQEWLMATRRALDSASVAELGDLDPRGARRLRQQLASYLA